MKRCAKIILLQACLLAVAVWLTVAFKDRQRNVAFDLHRYGECIDMCLCSFYSKYEIGQQFNKMVGPKTAFEVENGLGAIGGFDLYEVTNGTAEYVFILASNYPHGTSRLSLYCYKLSKPKYYLLCGFVPLLPINYYSEDMLSDRGLDFENVGEYTKVFFRRSLAYVVSTNWPNCYSY